MNSDKWREKLCLNRKKKSHHRYNWGESQNEEEEEKYEKNAKVSRNDNSGRIIQMIVDEMIFLWKAIRPSNLWLYSGWTFSHKVIEMSELFSERIFSILENFRVFDLNIFFLFSKCLHSL